LGGGGVQGEERDSDDNGESGREFNEFHKEWEYSPFVFHMPITVA